MASATELAPLVGVNDACQAVGVGRASFYRHERRPPAVLEPAHPLAPAAPLPSTAGVEERPAEPAPTRGHPRALSEAEQQAVLDVLHAPRFRDAAPAAVYATLLDEGIYLASERTLYRLLAAAGETRERRDQLVHPPYHKPELLATAPNQVWSWDITKLLGPAKWTYYYLYVLLDIYSRYVPGWMVAHREHAALAERLMAETIAKQGIPPGQLTLHADRGPAMTAKSLAQLLDDLGVTKTHSRPYTANDNPFSEAQFKTMKYRPDYPERFADPTQARTWAHTFFGWYNNEHHHTSLGLLTPAIVHYGQATQVTAQRQATLTVAYNLHPERFVKGGPRPPQPPTAVWINPPLPARAEPDAIP